MMHGPEYELIAQAIYRSNNLSEAILELCYVLKKDNPKFQPERFVKSCGFEDK